MEIDRKVYHSDITKGDCKDKDHLYELLKIEPAESAPRSFKCIRKDNWEFIPNHDKHYVQRRVSKLKVKTVKDVRVLLEKDVSTYLADDLEIQKKFLLRKIRDGSANDSKTKDSACKILKTDQPISRSAWQMLVNINPEGCNHPKQYVLWNGKCIQVNGSRGGKTKFICKYDLKTSNRPKLRNTSAIFKNNTPKQRIGLLRNSLKVKFKPGPLGKKKFLDDSLHKYQTNHIEVAKLPKPALEISPVYGTVLEPTISNFINNLRGETGVVSQKLAEFAVSVLGTINDSTPTQLHKECCINFDLNYKCDQNRILMRRNSVETAAYKNIEHESIPCENVNVPTTMLENSDHECNPNNSMIEIKTVLDEILNAVDISLMQDSMYSTETDDSRNVVENVCTDINLVTKDKSKRKYFELDKLDVTVIKLPENSRKDCIKTCEKSFCSLGCVCDSLEGVFNLKQHCGALDCMFGCKCEVSKYKDIELLERDCSDIIPGLINLDHEMNFHLAKEEQKFHQTVIVSGEKSIVLKSRKRICKAAKKYEDFYEQKIKSDPKTKKILTVDIQNLNCKTVEPLCMVHNLYKCFCNGKFVESYIPNNIIVTKTTETSILNKNDQTNLEQEIDIDGSSAFKLCLERNKEKKYKGVSVSESNSSVIDLSLDDNDLCARVMGYTGRKFTESSYKSINKKIKDMEKDDDLLKKKMSKLVFVAREVSITTPSTNNVSSESLNNSEITNKPTKVPKDIDCTFSNVQGNSILKPGNETSNKPENVTEDTSCIFLNVEDKSISKDGIVTSNKPDNVIEDIRCIISNVENKSISKVDNVTSNEPENITESISYTFLNLIDNNVQKASDVVKNKSADITDDVSYPLNAQGKSNMKDTVTSHPENINDDTSYPFSNAQGKSSLRNWLESSYKIYKDRIGQGIFKNCLETPKKGKASLQTWDFILSRYKERKNLFLVTKQRPYRTFLAVDVNNPSFTNCINIDDIRYADHHKYPQIIQNLVTNTTDSPNSFCILRGWNNYWELIGSAVKVIERSSGNQSKLIEQYEKDPNEDGDTLDDDWANKRAVLRLESEPSFPENNERQKTVKDIDQDNNNPDKSKWFVMTVENDFTEIQFYNRGFYVTYDGIQRSIYVARIYGKTVRLSLQSRTVQNDTHQFGIYAIPSTSESCVFIGPYDMNEPLGIEVVKEFKDNRKQKKTRGVWITTNKVDDMKVIEHPLSYMPSISSPNQSMVTLDSNSNSNDKLTSQQDISDTPDVDSLKCTAEKEALKTIKPIKISRKNGFYQLSDDILHKISPKKPLLVKKTIKVNKNTKVIRKPVSLLAITDIDDDMLVRQDTEGASSSEFPINSKPLAEILPKVSKIQDSNPESVIIRPVAEIAPQIKITSVLSHADFNNETASSNKSKTPMLILKPEEINKKVIENSAKDDMSMDIENFLINSTVCVAPSDEVFVISDCEDEDTSWKDVWIECSNIDDFGFIRGRLNHEKMLSFEFPGFNFSDFYPENEALEKINQAVARKIYNPQHFVLKWNVVEKEENLKSELLTSAHLRNKRYLHSKLQSHRRKRANLKRVHRTNSEQKTTESEPPAKQAHDDWHENRPSTTNKFQTTIVALEERSRELDSQSTFLWNQAIQKREALMTTLNVPEKLKDGMTEKLQDIVLSLDE